MNGDLASQQFHGVLRSLEVALHCSQLAPGEHRLLERCFLALETPQSGVLRLLQPSAALIAGVGRIHVIGSAVQICKVGLTIGVMSAFVLSAVIIYILQDADVHNDSRLFQGLNQSQQFTAVLVCCEEGILWVKLFSMEL